MIKLTDEQVRCLKSVAQHFDNEDLDVYYRQVRRYKKLKYYWDGITNLYGNNVAHDWRIWDSQLMANNADQADAMYYDKNINVFRAYLESIIAALSITIPAVKCYPDDADNVEDLTTAKCGDKIFELVSKHQNISLLWLHALFIHCTEGLVCAYNYTKEDEQYGTYETDKYEDVEEEVEQKICSVCQTNLVEEKFTEQLINEFDPSTNDVEIQDILASGKLICPSCAAAVDPVIQKQKLIVTRVVGKTTQPKSRECIEVYGGLYVKLPNYAKKQSDCPYLTLADEINVVSAIELYPDLASKFQTNSKLQAGSSNALEDWVRTSTQYRGSEPQNVVTRKRTWLRPEAFNQLKDEDKVKEFKKKYPFGCKITRINDEVMDVIAENLDDHWTLACDPLSDYLHHDPLGEVLVSIQDITKDLISLTLQTIEHGIPQTFADPSVLNFNSYGQMESKPGMIYPAKPQGGKSIGDGFYEIKTATLGSEVLPFSEKIQEAGQLVSGALPSLFGGAAPNSSKTAAQYAMSRAQALQRLQTPWKMLSIWWKEIFGKVIPSYIKCVIESGDERIVKKNEEGNFINVLIRKSELMGKIGSVELESTEELPVSWSQKKEVVMMLLQSSNPMILEAITSPDNLPLLRQAIGLNEFNLPGEEDREKQLEEIRLLLQAEPIMNPETQQEMPSVDIEPMVDNNHFEAEVCKRWLKSDAGRLAKTENAGGYKNVLLHMMRHVEIQKALAALNGQGPMPSQPQQQQLNQNQVDKGQPAMEQVQQNGPQSESI